MRNKGRIKIITRCTHYIIIYYLRGPLNYQKELWHIILDVVGGNEATKGKMNA